MAVMQPLLAEWLAICWDCPGPGLHWPSSSIIPPHSFRSMHLPLLSFTPTVLPLWSAIPFRARPSEAQVQHLVKSLPTLDD